ncbi:MAG: hypothetical protein LBU83_10330 [Bacteroidales bacterium]|jgi:hypothetical protein|nr:hypothetical protein [Bacteroidales bacterium]
MIIKGNLPPVGFNQQRTNQSFHMNSKPVFGIGGMPTKGASNLNDNELKSAFEELAKKHVAAGKNLSQAYHSSELQNLMTKATSTVSPDRAGIINNTLSGLAGKLQRMMPMLNMNRFCLLQTLMGNSNIFNTRSIGNNFIHFNDSSGNIIAMFSQQPNGSMGWDFVPTDAETARMVEFRRIYNDAFDRARAEPQIMKHNELTMAEINAGAEYRKLAAEVKLNKTPDNIAAKNAAREAYEAATHSRLTFEGRI